MIRSGLSLMIGMVLGRFLGLLREVILFRQFGTTLESDILIALITLPDILISLFVGNAMPVVFLKRIQLSGPRQKLRFLLKLSLYFFAGFILISFVLFVFPAPLAKTIFPMHHNSQVFLEGLRWVIWTIPILCLNSITRVFLQSEGKLFLVGLENVIFNLAIIAGILMLHGKLDVKIVSIALLAGALLRWLTQLLQIVFILRRNPEQKAEKKNDLGFSMRDMQIYTVALVTGFAIQFFPIAARSISSQFAGIGSLSIFNYAFKLIELPIALMLTVFSTVFLPKLVLASNLGKSKMNELLSRIWTMVNFIFPLSFSTSAFFFILSHSGTLFNYELNVEMINVLKLTAIGLLAFAFRCYNETFIVALSAKTIVNDQFKSASLAGIMGLILALAMTYKFGLDGTFWATNIYYTLLAGFNYYFLRKNNIGEKMSHVFAWRNFKLFSTCTALVLLVLFERTFGYTNFVLSVILGFVIVSSILILVKIKEIGKYCSENL